MPDISATEKRTDKRRLPRIAIGDVCLRYLAKHTLSARTEILTYLESSEYVLKVPPSPSLSACKMRRMYLTVTIKVMDHRTSESAPSRSMWLGASVKTEENTYRGEVPMSP